METDAHSILIIMMPNMNGRPLFDRMVEKPEWGQIPFVYLTARGLDSDVRYGKELGIEDCLLKSVAAKGLLAVIRGKPHRAHRVVAAAGNTGPSGYLITFPRRNGRPTVEERCRQPLAC